jgi:hypothetical protein
MSSEIYRIEISRQESKIADVLISRVDTLRTIPTASQIRSVVENILPSLTELAMLSDRVTVSIALKVQDDGLSLEVLREEKNVIQD